MEKFTNEALETHTHDPERLFSTVRFQSSHVKSWYMTSCILYTLQKLLSRRSHFDHNSTHQELEIKRIPQRIWLSLIQIVAYHPLGAKHMWNSMIYITEASVMSSFGVGVW